MWKQGRSLARLFSDEWLYPYFVTALGGIAKHGFPITCSRLLVSYWDSLGRAWRVGPDFQRQFNIKFERCNILMSRRFIAGVLLACFCVAARANTKHSPTS